jgi:hypothetical protein
MKAIVAGTDDYGIGEELESEGAEVVRLENPVFGKQLEEAGIDTADLYVITEAEEAISVPLAKEQNPDVRAVFYGDGSVPESVSAVLDLAVDPALLDADAVAEELTRE